MEVRVESFSHPKDPKTFENIVHLFHNDEDKFIPKKT